MFAAFLNIIKWKRLLYFSFVLFLFKYCFLHGYGFKTALSFFDLSLLTLSFSSLFASGHLINYSYRKHIKKVFSVKKSKIAAYTLMATGLCFGILLSFKINKPYYSLIFVFLAFIEYMYSFSFFKKNFFNNLFKSFLIPFALICLLWFDSPINLNSSQWDLFFQLELTVIIYATISFLSNLAKDLLMDIKNIDEDNFKKHETIPILLGRKRAKSITLLSLIFLCFIVFTVALIFSHNKYIFYTIIFLGTVPELYLIYRLLNSSSSKDYESLYKIANIIYLIGVLSVPIIAYYFKYVIG